MNPFSDKSQQLPAILRDLLNGVGAQISEFIQSFSKKVTEVGKGVSVIEGTVCGDAVKVIGVSIVGVAVIEMSGDCSGTCKVNKYMPAQISMTPTINANFLLDGGFISITIGFLIVAIAMNRNIEPKTISRVGAGVFIKAVMNSISDSLFEGTG